MTTTARSPREGGARPRTPAGGWRSTSARWTSDLVSEELDQPTRTHHDDRVYAASARELLAIVRSLDEAHGTVVLVGHNPGMEDLAETLTGDHVAMPTSALAVIELPGTWDTAGRVLGRLRAAGRPPTPVVH